MGKKEDAYTKLARGRFGSLISLGDDKGYRLTQRYTTMEISAEVDNAGHPLGKTRKKATFGAWVLAILTFPLGTPFVWLYMGMKEKGRVQNLDAEIRRCIL